MSLGGASDRFLIFAGTTAGGKVSFEAHMQGLGSIDKIFQQFNGPIQKKVMYKAIRAGLKDVRDSAEQYVSKDTGRTADALKIRMSSKSSWRMGEITGRVAVTGKVAPLAHLLEWGRQSFIANRPFKDKRGRFRSGTTGGGALANALFGKDRQTNFKSLPPQRFMTRAYLEHEDEIPRDVMRGIVKGMRQAVRGQRIR